MFIDKKLIQQSINDLENNGIKIKFIDFKKENILNKLSNFFLLFNPSKIYFKQNKYLQQKLKSYQEEINPDIFLYCAQSLEWSKNLKKFCPLIELPFLNSKLWLNFAIKKISIC